MSEAILKVESLWKRYDKKDVLKGIDLEIRNGEIFGIIGSSGSGKTTLLNSLIGFVRPTQGEVLFRNPHLLSYGDDLDKKDDDSFSNVLKHEKEVKRVFGFAAQIPSVYSKLTLPENLDLFGSLYSLSQDARHTNAKILLKLMGLYDSRHLLAESLSGGMLKRLDIACALIHDPKILILDEPTADLDPYLRKQMWHLIRKINKKGTTIILSSHFLDELEELCDRIGVIHNGQMKKTGTPHELKKAYSAGDEVHVTTTYSRFDILQDKLHKEKKLAISEMVTNGSELIIRTKRPLYVVQTVTKITNSIEDQIIELRMNKPSLNRIFEDIINNDPSPEPEPVKKSFFSFFFGKKTVNAQLPTNVVMPRIEENAQKSGQKIDESGAKKAENKQIEHHSSKHEHKSEKKIEDDSTSDKKESK